MPTPQQIQKARQLAVQTQNRANLLADELERLGHPDKAAEALVIRDNLRAIAEALA